MQKAILGISAYYHDSAAAVLVDGDIAAAAQEERFTRKKYDSSFPTNAIRYVLAEAAVTNNTLSAVVFYDKPYIKLERLLETYHAFAPRGLNSFLSAMPVWIKEKLFIKRNIGRELARLGIDEAPLLFSEHHLSHAASAFYPSPFSEAAILTLDGVGEWATAIIAHGKNNQITVLRELDFPHSIGLLYSAFTAYLGFRVNGGEYKLMGLAPYGNLSAQQTETYKNKIIAELVDIREDGSILLNMDYFDFATKLRMFNEQKWQKLFGIPPREPESELAQEHMNIALAIQRVVEDIILRLARTAKQLTNSKYLVLAGGVALNSVANRKVLAAGIFEDIWVQPAAGDAGGALGAAYAAWHISMNKPRNVYSGQDAMRGAYLGPEYDDKDIRRILNKYEAGYTRYADSRKLAQEVATLLSSGNVVGWFQGRMEYGPRALGNRSILADPRHLQMQKRLNLKIKYREGFRPFAPSVLEEDVGRFFELDRPSPYMLLVVPVKTNRRNPLPQGYASMDLYDRLYFSRSDIPAITHIDYSARPQSVNGRVNPRFWGLINAFKEKTGYGLLVNTSFNVRGEPIVCTPEDAYLCFMRTEMDYLVLGDYLLQKKAQSTESFDLAGRKPVNFSPD